MRTKKLIAIILLVAILITVSVVTVTSASPKVVRVGMSLMYGFFEEDEEGNYSGLLYDYFEEIAKYTGWSYEYVLGTQGEIFEKFTNKEVDLVGLMVNNEETRKIALFPEYTCGSVNTVLNVRANDTEISDIEYIRKNKPTIGIWQGAGRLRRHLDQFATDNGLVYKPKFYTSLDSLSKGLEDKEVDIILSDDTNRVTANQRSIARFSAMPHYIATQMGNTDILRELNMALKNINSVNPNFNSEISQKYFTDVTKGTFVLSASEREYIYSGKVHVVVGNPNSRPIQYFSDEGELKGIGAEVINYIARSTGLVFQYKETASFDESLELLSKGQADILAFLNSQGEIAEDNNLVKSAPYLPLNLGMIKRSDSDIDQMSKPALVKSLSYVIKDNNVEPTYYGTVEECIDAVNKGEADYTYSSSYVAEYLTQREHYGNIVFVPYTEPDNSICLGLSQPIDPTLLTIINKALGSITAEQLQTMVLKNTVVLDKEVSLKSYIQANPTNAMLILSAIFVLIVLFVVVIFIMRSKSNKKMYSMANVDEVTGAMTFSRFKKQAASIIKTSPLQHALISFDINKFKVINDLFGHKRGDEILKKIVDIIDGAIDDNEIFTRINADNFNILVEYRSDGTIVGRLTAINKQISTCFEGYHIDAVFGIYRIPKGDIDEIVTMSDCANLAKLSIKGKPNIQYAFYDEMVRSAILREKEIENLMEEALFASEFKLYLQPKYCFKTGKIIGAEALVRWDNIERGMIYPNDFIPLFEKNGFIQRLDLYMFEKVCQFQKNFSDGSIPDVSVNFSRVHLNNLNLANELVAITKKLGVDPKHIEVELTESAIFDNEERMIRVMNDLKKEGFVLSIDDFGSGYSSLSTLKNLPADVIKFDRGFLLESTDSQRGKDIIKYLVHMSRSLNLTTVAEGVETQQQVDFLKEVGCDIAQGFYYAKPMPANEFAELYKKETTE